MLATCIYFVIFILFCTVPKNTHALNLKYREQYADRRHECVRPCIDGEAPQTCYYHFYLEQYSTMGRACNDCNNEIGCQCIVADGLERTVYTVNRMIPGPSIDVCEGDIVIVDVENHIDGSDVTIHWHGIWQNGTQYYDGVPFVTQCPIPFGTSFRYKWYATNAGTHFWHSHSGFQKMDGLFGSIIVRQTRKNDYHSRLYNFDDDTKVIIINDWFHHLSSENFPGGFQRKNFMSQTPDAILINGKGQIKHPDAIVNKRKEKLEKFIVQRGNKYRFRLINVFGSICPVLFTIDNHNVTVISSDGEPIVPILVNGFFSFSAERIDFILHANQVSTSSYWIQVKAFGTCQRKSVIQLAILQYTNGPDYPRKPPPLYSSTVPLGTILNYYFDSCNIKNPNAPCCNQLKTVRAVDKDVLKKNADVKLFLPFGTYVLNNDNVFKENMYNKFIVINNTTLAVNGIDSILNKKPSSPLISQYYDNDQTKFCNKDNQFQNCSEYCHCTHKINIPLNAVVELILLDDSTLRGSHHTFHLHGFAFNVIGMGSFQNVSGNTNLDKAQELDRKGLLQRRFSKPAFKDTLAVPSNGYVIIRFKANNPGFWLLHCHFLYHLITGMSLILQVGELSDLPPVPPHFPTCGNFNPDL